MRTRSLVLLATVVALAAIDPLANLRDLQNVKFVMKGGAVVRDELAARYTRVRFRDAVVRLRGCGEQRHRRD
jgi:hypothetical protein